MLPPSPPEPSDEGTPSTNPSSAPAIPSGASSSFSVSTVTPSPSKATLPPPAPLAVPPRNRSPLPRAHLRSQSLAGTSSAPFMTRAHSSPGLDSRGRYVYSTNQSDSQNSRHFPFRRPSPLRVSIEESTDTIHELPEFQNNSSSPSIRRDMSPVPHSTFPRQLRRRPSSPLHSNHVNAWGSTSPMTQSTQPSPFALSARYNEPHPAYSFSSGSSMPSTPSSMRSRSPSISSLETIPDIPDAEAAAVEADQIAKLKAAADKADSVDGEDMDRRRSSMDGPGSPSPFGGSRFNFARADKRKRWSVCGAEGRHDLDLETIWED